jgi:tetratricopeptide (TPR) repeat protein
MRAGLVGWVTAVVAVLCFGMGGTGGGATATTTPTPILPSLSSPLAPSQLRLSGPITGDTLTETESCAGCHADAAAQWQSSAHAFGSFNNPVYRLAIDRFRSTVGKEASRFCAGCHDVALLVDGAMSGEVRPGDSRAHGGVTCRICHGIESTRADGNASFTLSSAPIPIPREGDDGSLRAHKDRMALAPLRTAEMCGTCHRSFLSPETGNVAHLVGQDDLGAWRRSIYAGSMGSRVDEAIAPAECRGCHMPLEDASRGDAAAKAGKIRSHRFAAGHTWLASMRGDAPQVDADRAMLHGAASIDIAAAAIADGTRTLPADGAPAKPGDSIVLDVVVRNERAGHRFPGGVVDAQDTWIEVQARDSRGNRLGQAGVGHEGSGSDTSAHVLRAAPVDERGSPLMKRETDRFRAAAYDHTIAPRDAEVVRYLFEVPRGLDPRALPIRVTARLRHRSRNLAVWEAVCAESRTARGAAFAREVAIRTGASIDPCRPEPVTDVATGEIWIGQGALSMPTSHAYPSWRRLYDHGLGLLHARQEDVDLARPSLERALLLVPPGDERARAMVLGTMADVAIVEGRTDEAWGLLDEAESFTPFHPAIAHARGRTLGNVWKWSDAAGFLERSASASPLDDVLWSHLAVARGAAGDPAGALAAAGHGLRLTPRDSDCLRVQALALPLLGGDGDAIEQAREAFERWRPPDDAPAVKSACSKRSRACALERVPVHTHALTLPFSAAPGVGRRP